MHRLVPLICGLLFAATVSSAMQAAPPSPRQRASSAGPEKPSQTPPATPSSADPETLSQTPPSTPPPADFETPPQTPPAIVAPALPLPTPGPGLAPVVATSADARVFASEAGAILNPIKKASTAQFEAVIQKLKEALRLSDNEVRRQQANGWKVYRVAEAGGGGTIVYYLFLIDPVVKGADYTISKLLNEAYPDQINDLQKQFLTSYAGGQTLLNLTLVTNLRIGAK